MLESMRQLALARLCSELRPTDLTDPEEWYNRQRQDNLIGLFPFLVEDVSDDEAASERARYYTLAADPDDSSIAVLKAHELTAEAARKLPFNKPSGSQSPALGPVIKRTAPSKTKTAGPSAKIRNTTLDSFEEIAGAGRPWSGYFREAHSCWSRPRLRVNDWVVEARDHAYQEAIDRIDEKRTVLLAYLTADHRLPGEASEFVAYLQETLAGTKYATKEVGPRSGQCALCAVAGEVYPKALFGAGFNIGSCPI